MTFVQNILAYNVDEIDHRGQFHQQADFARKDPKSAKSACKS